MYRQEGVTTDPYLVACDGRYEAGAWARVWVRKSGLAENQNMSYAISDNTCEYPDELEEMPIPEPPKRNAHVKLTLKTG